jgi:hypothetical protein
MFERINSGRRVSVGRFALCFGIAAAALIGPIASTAHADNRDRRPEYGRDHGWREGYYHRPDVYYSAPPVVYPPTGYYQQPGVSLNFAFPLVIR